MAKKPRKPQKRKSATLAELVEAVLVPARTPGNPLYNKLSTTYQSQYSKLTDAQLKAIGHVAANWSILEWVFEMLLSRLALVPGFPARALTNDLGPDNRLKAASILVKLHLYRYRGALVDSKTLEQIADLLKVIASLKDERNQVVHWLWSRMTDDSMFGIRHRPAIPSLNDGSYLTLKPGQIDSIANAIRDTADVLLVLAQRIPDIDEERLVRSLLPKQRRHRREGE